MNTKLSYSHYLKSDIGKENGFQNVGLVHDVKWTTPLVLCAERTIWLQLWIVEDPAYFKSPKNARRAQRLLKLYLYKVNQNQKDQIKKTLDEFLCRVL